MPGSKTNAHAARWLDHEYGLAPYVAPATRYLRLFTTAIDEDGVGTEAAGNGYAPVAVPNDATTFVRTGQTVSLVADLSCGTPTGGDWGVIRGAGFSDTPGGALTLYSNVTPLQTVEGGEVTLPAGEFSHTET
ncbi:phage tail fiber protein [Miltoncostaea marina]|uniref:phage tail fiber protein n=1 Tax=Miltoncostaea marina TaxID=2843215 RepID=UPI001C3CAFD3|nr:hypothetical protein [Miltoncostaea marina]